MRDIYTSQFEVISLSKSPESTAQAVFFSTLKWISDWYDSKFGMKLDITSNCKLEPQDRHSLWTTTESTDLASIRMLQWSYPHKDNLHWTVGIQCSRYEDSIDFSLRLMIESTQFFIAPLDFEFGRPRIIPSLLREFECYYGGVRLSAEASIKVASDVPLLVSERLLNPERRLPIVVISPENGTGLPVTNSNDIASMLAGIAEVYVLADRWASYAFTDEVGKLLSCYNGAIRAYWPLGKRTLEAYCPVFMPNMVKERGSAAIGKSLLKDFSSISSFRYIAGPISEDAATVLREHRESEAKSLRLAAQERGDFEAIAESYRQELVELKEAFAKLKLRESSLQEEVGSLRTRSETDQANLRAMYTVTPASLATEDQLEHPSEVITIPEVVCEAEKDYVGTLVFTKNAHKAANETPYKQPDRVKEALEAMAVVCNEWKASKAKRTSMGSFEEAFETLGFIYKSRVSQTSVGKWSEEYEMVYKGQRTSIQPHLAIGKGGPETCLRIYFHIDQEEDIFVIDHVGRHKTNIST